MNGNISIYSGGSTPPREPGADVLVRAVTGETHRIRCNAAVRVWRDNKFLDGDASIARPGDFLLTKDDSASGWVVAG